MTSDHPRLSSRLFNGLALLTVTIPVVAWSTLLPVHNVRARTTYFYEGSTVVSSISGQMTISWQENSPNNFANLRAESKAGDSYELSLSSTTTADSDEVQGTWNVSKNGVPQCINCKGYLYVAPPTLDNQYLKGYVQDSKGYAYSFAGDITSRSDY
jgi:hypothetical protein